jgi:ferredoxin
LTNCVFCKHRNPVIYDELIGELVQEDEKVDEFSQVREFEAKGRDERWAYFCEQTSKCIRCYACRNACPLCYCKECFVDSTRPRWIGTTLNPSDVQMYHIIRAFHTAGRCVDCGACVRACPMGIDIRMLTEKLIKDVRDFFDYEAGISIEEPPALASYKEDDPDKFII